MENQELINLNMLLHCLVECSEKACCIAHVCRHDKELFQLLVEEKKENEKNKRFIQDFKTLADVLVQETVRWEVSKKFPALKSNIFGEENSKFKNTLGDSVQVQVFDSIEETTTLLSKVLDGRDNAARALTHGIYEDTHINIAAEISGLYLSANKIGIWIDPIDSTGEYVRAKNETEATGVLVDSGLQCVCVLIGAYNLDTGYPILGVINQPFHSKNSKTEWMNMYYWGICHDGYLETSIPTCVFSTLKKRIVVSSCENEQFLDILRLNYDVYLVAGAGYKCLIVARGDADLYVLSRPTTYFWDTCGPQAILMACGGSIIDFRETLSRKNINKDDLKHLQLKYMTEAVSEPKFCNTGGVIAYKNSSTVLEFVQFFHDNCTI